MDLYRWLPPEGVKILLVLFLSFLIGLEREEHKLRQRPVHFWRRAHFPAHRIDRLRHGASLWRSIVAGHAGLRGGGWIPAAVLLAQVGRVHPSRRHNRDVWTGDLPGGRAGLSLNCLILDRYHLSVAGVFLLELKTALENLTKRVPGDEILTFTKFLLLTAVVLPILPNQDFGPIQINPFKTWLVVVAVSAVSYGSYVIGRLTKGGGVVLAAILGGAYSSTVTTLVLARRAARERQPHLFSGRTLIASGMMYLRLAVLLALFNRGLLAISASGLPSPCWPSLPSGLAGCGRGGECPRCPQSPPGI